MSTVAHRAWAALAKRYEQFKLYKANPCDFDAVGPLKPLGEALASLTTACPCCTGARIVIAAVLTALWPVVILGLLGLWLFIAYASAAWDSFFDVESMAEDEKPAPTTEQKDEDVHR